MLTRRRRSPAALASLVLAASAVGCAGGKPVLSGPTHPDGPLKCQAVASKDVVVSPPEVAVQDGMMTVTGTIHRQPGVTGLLDGRVDVDLIGPDGLKLDTMPLHAPMVPGAVPMDPSASAVYSPTKFGYAPPPGSIIRARYVDYKTMINENLRDGILEPNGNGGHTGEGVSPTAENGSSPVNPTPVNPMTNPNATPAHP